MNNIFIISKETKEKLFPLRKTGTKYINGGNWIQLTTAGAKRLQKDFPKIFTKIENMGYGESQLTINYTYTVSDL